MWDRGQASFQVRRVVERRQPGQQDGVHRETRDGAHLSRNLHIPQRSVLRPGRRPGRR